MMIVKENGMVLEKIQLDYSQVGPKQIFHSRHSTLYFKIHPSLSVDDSNFDQQILNCRLTKEGIR